LSNVNSCKPNKSNLYLDISIAAAVSETEEPAESVYCDTSSTVSLVKLGVSLNKLITTSITPFGETGNELDVTGVQVIELCCYDFKYNHQFHVCILPTDADGIMGMDFLARVNAKLYFEKEELTMLKCAVGDHATLDRNARGTGEKVNKTALTLFTTSAGKERKQLRQLEKVLVHETSEKGRRQPFRRLICKRQSRG
jgi:hypothetical protein